MGRIKIEHILKNVQNGTLSIEEAKNRLTLFDDIGFAKLDISRHERTGFPEVVYAEGKTVEQLVDILKQLKKKTNRVLATRVSEKQAIIVHEVLPELHYNPAARTLSWIHPDEPQSRYQGYIAVVCGGTSDIPVAEEAVVTAETFGCKVERFYDVGVAGIHRLFNCIEEIRNASASIVVAGMEGALPSVLGGLVDHPLIAVPTSIGYGANLNGVSALLSMLNACAPGINVVNIDNGFGAGYNAAQILRISGRQEK
ncbi:nickel pincer cofactor biosynthesis protein LarB [Cytobacillus oceanisediminis]|uniref:nickel pincer cofactor biosynthesis protein LarB n=1 Tax=Cytobacillus oceanisediminis TaxID=665099 RepID=UPI0011A6A935|nr:nickel pincer cofactor biosynthesis protein LarB [Cytobacillus oceanisediminis]